jgi:hypothetical protein
MMFAWYFNNKEMELLAFQNLAIQFFYLGEITSARFYNERAIRGIVEADSSQNKVIAKQLYVRLLKQRNKENSESVGVEFGLKNIQNVIVTRTG